jgi:hypothetical protein
MEKPQLKYFSQTVCSYGLFEKTIFLTTLRQLKQRGTYHSPPGSDLKS